MMKNNKGITLISLGIYIVGLLIALSVLSLITTHYRGNLNRMYREATYSIDYDRLNMYLIGETEKENNPFTVAPDGKSVTFGTGSTKNVYEVIGGSTVWLLEKNSNNENTKAIKIAGGLIGCQFEDVSSGGKNILKVTVTLRAATEDNPNEVEVREIKYVGRY